MSKKHLRRPETTLFLSCSVDSKLTGHDSDAFDANKHWKESPGIRALLQRFYDFQDPKTCAVTSGETMKLTGINNRVGQPSRLNLSLIVFDHTSSLTPKGVHYLASCVKKLYFISSPARLKHLKRGSKNLHKIPYKKNVPLRTVSRKLYASGVRFMTVHSDAVMNVRWLAEDLIDSITVVIAPLIVAGNGTPVFMPELPFDVKVLTLVETRAIDDSYLFLRYTVLRTNA